MARVVVFAVVGLLAPACATARYAGGASVPADHFPKRAQVEALAATTQPLDLKALGTRAVETWTLEGPFPSDTQVTAHPPVPTFDAQLREGAALAGAQATSDLHCIAREAGRVYLEHDAHPGDALRDFILGRCGTTAAQVRFNVLAGTVPADYPMEKLATEWAKDVAKTVASVARAKGRVGLWVGRKGDRLIAFAAGGAPQVELAQPLSLVPGVASVVVRGRVDVGAVERVDVMVNHGALDAVACKSIDTPRLPDFAFECPLLATDDSTWLEIAAFEPGRILGHDVGTFLLWPKGQPRNDWKREGEQQMVPEGQLAQSVVDAVNALRVQAKLKALVDEPAQSATAAALVPRYVAAQFGKGDPADADQVALALMAGWNVTGEVVTSHFGNTFVSGSRDVSVLVDSLMRSPFQRKAITARNVTKVAVGAIEAPGVAAMGVILSSYALLPAFDRKEAEVEVISRLNQMRLDRGRSLAQWTLWPQDVAAEVEQNLKSRAWTPDTAFQYVLDSTAQVAKGQVTGYVQLVDDLDHFQFPVEVLQREAVNVFFAVGVYRGPDWPQTRYVVCFVLANASDIEVASR